VCYKTRENRTDYIGNTYALLEAALLSGNEARENPVPGMRARNSQARFRATRGEPDVPVAQLYENYVPPPQS